jgi:hypothetical protein
MLQGPEYYIINLELEPHPEGGYFRENYRSSDLLDDLPSRYAGSRNASTAIYYLLKGNQYSAFHKVMSDEIWHFYDGCCLELYIIDPQARLVNRKLGKEPGKNEVPQLVIPHGHWFAAQPVDPAGYTLAGCTVAPGFDFLDFELGDREMLIQQFPQHDEIIRKYTRDGDDIFGE